jgi:hypothetical protein
MYIPSDQTTRDKKLILRNLIGSTDRSNKLTMKHMDRRSRAWMPRRGRVPERKFHVPDRKKQGVTVCLIVKKGLLHVPDRKSGWSRFSLAPVSTC